MEVRQSGFLVLEAEQRKPQRLLVYFLAIDEKSKPHPLHTGNKTDAAESYDLVSPGSTRGYFYIWIP